MKKVKLSILALLAIAAIAPSCKKGEEDPGLSLRSRKSRIAGEWSVTSFDITGTNTTVYVPTVGTTGVTGYTDTYTYTEKYADAGTYSGTWTTTSTQTGSTNGSGSETGTTKTLTYTFDKDGTWSSVMEYNVSSKQSGTNPATVVNKTSKEESSGTWQFLGKNKGAELKNKESISLSTTNTVRTETNITTGTNATTNTTVNTYTYATNENVTILHLSMLSNKEVRAEIEMNSTDAYTFSSATPSGSVSGS